MAYYQGDYYVGDYYVGDPGVGTFFKKALKIGGGIGASFIPGIGGVASRALSKLPVPARRVVAQATRTIVKHPVATAAGAAGVLGAGGEVLMGGRAATAGVGPQMMGAPRGRMMRLPGMRRRRRMNVTNVKALRRSIRRTQGFAKLAMRVIHMTHPQKHVRFGGFRKRTRRKKV